MEVQVLIERVEGNGYVARSALGLTAEGTTPNEAIQNLKDATQRKLTGGAKLTAMTVPAENENPWLAMAGTLDPNDPMVQEWVRAMAENRRAADSDPDVF